MTRAVVPMDTLHGWKRVGEDGWDYRVDAKAGVAYVWVKTVNAGTLHELRHLERRLRAADASQHAIREIEPRGKSGKRGQGLQHQPVRFDHGPALGALADVGAGVRGL